VPQAPEYAVEPAFMEEEGIGDAGHRD